MAKGNVAEIADDRRLLVERIAASPYVKRSARLRDLLLYLAERVLEGQAGEIHEQEVGHRVFDRPVDYDTTSDNIVRVHASMLRKRLEQYFASEGASEPLILEIPKGNYAPVFRARERNLPLPPVPEPVVEPVRRASWMVWLLAAIAVLFACSTVYLVLRSATSLRSPISRANSFDGARPTVRLFWEQVFQPDRPTDIVLDDAAAGLYQELTGSALTLSNYYDRAYLRSLPRGKPARGGSYGSSGPAGNIVHCSSPANQLFRREFFVEAVPDAGRKSAAHAAAVRARLFVSRTESE